MAFSDLFAKDAGKCFEVPREQSVGQARIVLFEQGELIGVREEHVADHGWIVFGADCYLPAGLGAVGTGDRWGHPRDLDRAEIEVGHGWWATYKELLVSFAKPCYLPTNYKGDSTVLQNTEEKTN